MAIPGPGRLIPSLAEFVPYLVTEPLTEKNCGRAIKGSHVGNRLHLVPGEAFLPIKSPAQKPEKSWWWRRGQDKPLSCEPTTLSANLARTCLRLDRTIAHVCHFRNHCVGCHIDWA